MNKSNENITLIHRIWELDFIRGLCVILMVCDHTLYDMGFLFMSSWFLDGGSGMLWQLCVFAHNIYWHHPLRVGVRILVVGSFIFICGICCSFSRSNYRRGLKLLAVALLLTLATAAMDAVSGYTDYYTIRCGVLHMLAASILVYAVLQRAGQFVSLLSGVLLLAVTLLVSQYPPNISGLIPFVLGIGGGSYSADYFPLLPWVGFFLIGAGLGSALYKNKCSLFPMRGESKLLRPAEFVGRHALWFYLLHQPVVYGLLLLVGLLL